MATSVLWRDLTLATGDDQPYRITSLEGWEELPAPRYDKQARARGHGAHPSPVWADERIVTVEGFTHDQARRDGLLRGLRAATAFGDGDDTEPLTITDAGLTLTAGAQLLAARPVRARVEWGAGRFGWLLQWRCPDPLRYGPPVTYTTGLPTAGGGLSYPLAYPLDYGAAGDPGQLMLPNPGTAPAPILFAVTGPLPLGFELTSPLGRLVYPAPVPAGQTLELDTATGTVLVERTASRRGLLAAADWMQVPPGTTLTVQLTSLGGAYSAAAQAAATVREAHW